MKETKPKKITIVARVKKATRDITGQRFGRWLVESYASSANAVRWNCLCDCGVRRVIKGTALRAGETHSCGCLKIEKLREEKKTHGLTYSREYRAWAQIKDRCFNSKCKNYKNYGARGIGMCQRWRESFESFYADVGPRPGPGYAIDRINNDGDYEPGNCRWITTKANNRNRRVNRLLTFDGRTLCASAWAEIVGVSTDAILKRLSRGWTVEQALTTPAQKKTMKVKRALEAKELPLLAAVK